MDPCTPPGFHIAHIGKQVCGEPSLTIQIDGLWDKSTNMGGMAWATCMNTRDNQGKQGSFCYDPSAIFTQATTCLGEITWTRDQGHMHLLILTNSHVLVQLLLEESYGYEHQMDHCSYSQFST